MREAFPPGWRKRFAIMLSAWPLRSVPARVKTDLEQRDSYFAVLLPPLSSWSSA